MANYNPYGPQGAQVYIAPVTTYTWYNYTAPVPETKKPNVGWLTLRARRSNRRSFV